MKYASFLAADGSPTWGIIADGLAYDLGPTGAGLAPHPARRRRAGHLRDRRRGIPQPRPSRPEADIEFLPAITDPGKIICIGVNYRSHQNETGNARTRRSRRPRPSSPASPTRRWATCSRPGCRPPPPSSTTRVRWPWSSARKGSTSPKRTRSATSPATAPTTTSRVRDWQLATTQWIPGKNFPGTGGFGPYLVPAADLGDVNALTLETRVNGDIRQKASVADLYFSIPQLIAYVTGFTRLSPGDVIVTGTPGGVGRFMVPSGLLTDGDVVEVEITGLGTLRNTVRAASR